MGGRGQGQSLKEVTNSTGNFISRCIFAGVVECGME